MEEISDLVVQPRILSVAALFNNCIDHFQFLQLNSSFRSEYDQYHLKIDLIKLRLSRWGQAVRINQDIVFSNIYHEDEDQHQPMQQMRAILQEIEQVFRIIPAAISNYTTLEESMDSYQGCTHRDMSEITQLLHGLFADIARDRLDETELSVKEEWTIYDEESYYSFTELIIDYIEDLETLIPLEDELCQLAESEVECLNEEGSLTALCDISIGTDDLLSRVVARKFQRIEAQKDTVGLENGLGAQRRDTNDWNRAAFAHNATIVNSAEDESEIGDVKLNNGNG